MSLSDDDRPDCLKQLMEKCSTWEFTKLMVFSLSDSDFVNDL